MSAAAEAVDTGPPPGRTRGEEIVSLLLKRQGDKLSFGYWSDPKDLAEIEDKLFDSIKVMEDPIQLVPIIVPSLSEREANALRGDLYLSSVELNNKMILSCGNKRSLLFLTSMLGILKGIFTEEAKIPKGTFWDAEKSMKTYPLLESGEGASGNKQKVVLQLISLLENDLYQTYARSGWFDSKALKALKYKIKNAVDDRVKQIQAIKKESPERDPQKPAEPITAGSAGSAAAKEKIIIATAKPPTVPTTGSAGKDLSTAQFDAAGNKISSQEKPGGKDDKDSVKKPDTKEPATSDKDVKGMPKSAAKADKEAGGESYLAAAKKPLVDKPVDKGLRISWADIEEEEERLRAINLESRLNELQIATSELQKSTAERSKRISLPQDFAKIFERLGEILQEVTKQIGYTLSFDAAPLKSGYLHAKFFAKNKEAAMSYYAEIGAGESQTAIRAKQSLIAANDYFAALIKPPSVEEAARGSSGARYASYIMIDSWYEKAYNINMGDTHKGCVERVAVRKALIDAWNNILGSIDAATLIVNSIETLIRARNRALLRDKVKQSVYDYFTELGARVGSTPGSLYHAFSRVVERKVNVRVEQGRSGRAELRSKTVRSVMNPRLPTDKTLLTVDEILFTSKWDAAENKGRDKDLSNLDTWSKHPAVRSQEVQQYIGLRYRYTDIWNSLISRRKQAIRNRAIQKKGSSGGVRLTPAEWDSARTEYMAQIATRSGESAEARQIFDISSSDLEKEIRDYFNSNWSEVKNPVLQLKVVNQTEG